jgi:hypothetical protein
MKVLIKDDIEITDKIPTLDLSQLKTFERGTFTINEITVEAKNSDDFFSCDNPKSVYAGGQWLYTQLKIFDDSDFLIWNGVITDIEREHDNKTCRIISKDSLIVNQKAAIEYYSTNWETIADAAKNICIQVGYTDYNVGAMEKSIEALSSAGALCAVSFAKTDGLSFQQSLWKLAEYCGADIYMYNNELYFKHWTKETGGTPLKLNDRDFLEMPLVKASSNLIINNYEITYFGAPQSATTGIYTPTADTENNGIGAYSRSLYGNKALPQLNAVDGQIIFYNEATAIYIGETYIRKTHTNIDSVNPEPLRHIEFIISTKHKQYVNLETPLSITLSDEAWVNKIFNVHSSNINEEDQTITITAFERAS